MRAPRLVSRYRSRGAVREVDEALSLPEEVTGAVSRRETPISQTCTSTRKR
jgi:hypothetical protein